MGLRDEPLWKAEAIVAEECDKIWNELFERVEARIKAEVPSIKVVAPEPLHLWHPRIGPKSIGIGKCTSKCDEMQVALPICNLEEWKDG